MMKLTELVMCVRCWFGVMASGKIDKAHILYLCQL